MSYSWKWKWQGTDYTGKKIILAQLYTHCGWQTRGSQTVTTLRITLFGLVSGEYRQPRRRHEHSFGELLPSSVPMPGEESPSSKLMLGLLRMLLQSAC